MEKKIPDFIGFWQSEASLHEGLFFLNIQNIEEGNKVRGDILDLLGLARFEGEMTKWKVSFCKKYFTGIPARLSLTSKEIVYDGEMTREGIYVGKYHIRGESSSGTFKLEPVPNPMPSTLKDFYLGLEQACLEGRPII